jgi:hypothetical protein
LTSHSGPLAGRTSRGPNEAGAFEGPVLVQARAVHAWIRRTVVVGRDEVELEIARSGAYRRSLEHEPAGDRRASCGLDGDACDVIETNGDELAGELDPGRPPSRSFST